ncbi:diphosphomevalonate decarboxylase [Jeotgalibaca sp. MA1X17-3]|uniref:diphosphomevalonate decarboxylase n=1 Tax=Jeotgalibaca sp. MA1X17-3 TaxID=2908211 RepID=UPI001F48BD4D|nr:diphosphomevalonate decarboxylase [Jeotgalibaca sp. MA1X17-3]UJF16446.1 diphosphomevalonate decarboxylase [Jeotgalibaca sp. MA1X17-3]
MKQAAVRAHTNIALIKYWGKRDEHLFLPVNSSLSLTLDKLFTDTLVCFDPSLTEDLFYLNGTKQNQMETQKISRFINLFRDQTDVKDFVRVESINHVPTAAGLASSASAFAALAGAANIASGLQLEPQALSTYARRGSGSSTRSLFGGFVEWNKGTNSDDSMAIQIDDANWDIGMVIVAVNTSEKKVSSREGMKRTVETSPFYSVWEETAEADLVEIKQAISNQDFQTLGEITERNGMKMHGTMLGATPPLSYWEPASIQAIQIVKHLREQGVLCYVTMDAGPNVKVLCRLSEADKIKEALLEKFSDDQLLITGPGKGIRELTADEKSVYSW